MPRLSRRWLCLLVLLCPPVCWAEGPYLPVAAGSFLMGQSGNDPSSYLDEVPIHSVFVPAFSIGQYEVTNADYAAFLNAVGTTEDQHGNPYIDELDPDIQLRRVNNVWQPLEGKANHPMVEVSWYGADAYARWVGGRLPTEEEWEKAARWDAAANRSRVWPWGDVFDCLKNSSWWCNDPDATRPVGSFPAGASPYGALDMAGNVWEWTVGGYRSYPGSPLGTFWDHTREVQRGGSWTNSDYNLRCAARSPLPHYITDANLGFRVVKSEHRPLMPVVYIPKRPPGGWAEGFSVARPMSEVYKWWGHDASFVINASRGMLEATLRSCPEQQYPAGESMAMLRRSIAGVFRPGDFVDITVRLRYSRGDRGYARCSVAVSWGDDRAINPGGRGADENTGYPWYLIANNSDAPNQWHEVKARRLVWGEGAFNIGFGLWGNLSDQAVPPIVCEHKMEVDFIRVDPSPPEGKLSLLIAR